MSLSLEMQNLNERTQNTSLKKIKKSSMVKKVPSKTNVMANTKPFNEHLTTTEKDKDQDFVEVLT